jgi:hypothetical protein
VELLRAEEPSECDGADEEARKVEALKELNDMVTTLQEGGVEVCMSRVEAVAAVRRKAKDDVASREMLPMLDATPLLVRRDAERRWGGGHGRRVVHAAQPGGRQ